MFSKSRKKGISPLIASVFVLAFSVSAASMTGPMFTEVMQEIQSENSGRLDQIKTASSLDIDVLSVSYNQSSENFSVVIQNNGERIGNETNISIGLIADDFTKDTVYEVEIGSKEIKKFHISIDTVSSLNTLRVSLTGYPVSDKTKILCAPTRGMVGYWSFDRTEGGMTVRDDSMYSNDGSLDNTPQRKTGFVGDALQFGPDQRERVIVPDDNSLDMNKTLTLVSWVKLRAFNPRPQPFFDKGAEDPDPSRSYAMRLHGWHNSVKFNVKNQSSSCIAETTWGVIRPGKWYFVAGTFDNGKLEIYVDGELDAQKRCKFSNIKSSSDPLSLGRRTDWPYGYFNGTLDEMRVYNRSLNPEEIKTLYNFRSRSWSKDVCTIVD